MKKTIRIGTRDSQLALWQANTVADKLQQLGYSTELLPVKSAGDVILDKPLYEFGITGIFTKTLDVAMIAGQIDIAVHSMKDVPTALPKGIVQAAVLERETSLDILVTPHRVDAVDALTVATGSLRRKAQWLHRYPHHRVVDLRGNVNTRLQKLQDNGWDGAIFAAAGLKRIGIMPEHVTILDWMIPAPAQGAVVVAAMEHDAYSREALSKLNNRDAEICTQVERQFLRTLEGGCTAPIGALATVVGDVIRFEGALFSLDGVEKIHLEKSAPVTHFAHFGRECAEEVLAQGGEALMQKIRNQMKPE